jgi:hypothetical protein
MIKKSLHIVLILIVTGCAGTIKIAEETGKDITSSNTPAVTKGRIFKSKN